MIKKGDQVKILSGKDRGKTGKVLAVHPDTRRLVVEGVNVLKKRVRAKQQNKSGEIVDVPRSLDYSNVLLVCKNCKKPTRAGTRTEGQKKVRFCKKCEASL